MATYVQEFQGKIKAEGVDTGSITASGSITSTGAVTAPSFNGKATSAGAADTATNATNATNDGNGVNIASNYARQTGTYSGMTVGNADKATSADTATNAETANTANTATNATNAEKATSDADGNNIASTYAKQTGTYSGMTVGNATNADTATTASSVENVTIVDIDVAVGKDTTLPTGLLRGAVAIGTGSSAGTGSTAVGRSAAAASSSVAVGMSAKADMTSTAIGASASAGDGTGSSIINSVALGFLASATESNTIQLGYSNISSLRCAVNLTVTSDARDKTDITDITNALAFVEKLRPVQYVRNNRKDYISEEARESKNYRTYGMCAYDKEAWERGDKKGERKRVGLLAQEIQESLAEVYGSADYANLVDDDFHDREEVRATAEAEGVENTLHVAYSNIIPFLIGAVKELSAKVGTLEERIAALEAAANSPS